ncbi:DNA alkylation repair protein [Chitinophaga deserti]|uniref:DNA alkylation repair protein n=1 Tax=Chitinophaga deserti TaxID=2164099 RepID=UPI000D6AD967|nr:DNA alkylation repair protein [Chitinophaga deserti]
MSPLTEQLQQDLRAAGTPAGQDTARRFFKEDIKTYGVKSAATKAIAKPFLKALKQEPKAEAFAVCETLWQSGYMEETLIACDLSYSRRKEFVQADFKLFEKWLFNYVTNWAACDTFCNHTIGEMLMRFPALLPVMDKWAISKNRWVRRAAAVSLIVPARKGLMLQESLHIATLLLQDEDDMVRKGYGWLLKCAAEKHEEKVFRFVLQHRKEMPRTALRYAIEKMPQDLKQEAMAKI